MRFFVIRTDAPCLCCEDLEGHGYVTRFCVLQVYADAGTAYMISRKVEGSHVEAILELPRDIEYNVVTLRDGKPDPKIAEALARA